jgi:hypothetical protein
MYDILNDEQKEVVFAPIDKNIRIVASAGSGKTTTILYRVQYLLENNVDPSTIMLTTFNVDAADVLKERMLNRLKIDEKVLKKMYIGTIDSISYRFYKMYFSSDSYRGVQEFSNEFLKFLNTDKGKEKILDKFKYVFFDEFQDANNIQFDILKKFSDKSYVTVIGDDAQNIYQWRGSNIDYILNFDKYFDNTLTFKLQKNYRSTPDIVFFANESIKNNVDQFKKSLIPTKASLGILPLIAKVYNLIQHSNYIINRIKHYITLGTKLHEIAILSRNNYGLKKIEEELEKEKIPYVSLITDNDNSKIKIIPDHICLTTIHKSKGLEWDAVFVIQCEDAKFPSEIDPISIEEERRLFYVAVTRARIHLEITFISENVTRFVSELPSNLYHFPHYNKKYLEPNNKRIVKFEMAITKLVSQFESSHIEEMRKNGILPELDEEVNQVSKQLEIDSYISKYNFNQDYGTFIDRYICRKLQDVKDKDADIVINSLEISKKEHIIYLKYKVNILTKLNKVDKESINKLNKNPEDLPGVVDIDTVDLSILKSIAIKIFNMANKHNLEIKDILVLPESYLPEEFKNSMIESYKKFQSDNYDLKDVYDISLCSSVRDERRRLLYKDIFKKFSSNEKIFKYIDKWCTQFDDNINIKLGLNDESRFICGEIDMYDINTKTLIDFKVSSSPVKLEWILQLLTYTAIMRKQLNMQIDLIQIYNPLLGTETTFDITKWNKENELLDYIVKIRGDKMNKNTQDKQVTKAFTSFTSFTPKQQIAKPVTKRIIKSETKTLTKPKNLDEDFLDLNNEELEAMKNIKLVEKVKIKPKKTRVSK